MDTVRWFSACAVTTKTAHSHPWMAVHCCYNRHPGLFGHACGGGMRKYDVAADIEAARQSLVRQCQQPALPWCSPLTHLRFSSAIVLGVEGAEGGSRPQEATAEAQLGYFLMSLCHSVQSFSAWKEWKAKSARKKQETVEAERRRKGILTGREIFSEVGLIAQPSCEGCSVLLNADPCDVSKGLPCV